MTKNVDELVSRLKDGDLDLSEVDLTLDDSVQKKWQHYHLISDVLKLPSDESGFFIDVSQTVLQAIEKEQNKIAQPSKLSKFSFTQNIKMKLKQFGQQLQQVGMVAGIAVAFVTGIHFLDDDSKDDYLVINPVPIGIKTVPVGGIQMEEMPEITELQYNEIRFLMQEYELQKRLNTLN